MTVRIDANPLGQVPTGLSPGAGQQQSSTQAGLLGGAQVTVKDAASVLGDAAEEISLHMADSVESKTLGERKVKPGDRPRNLTIDQINAYLEKAKKLDDPEEMVRLAKQMLQRGGQQAGQLARNHPNFRSPTDQYMLLQFARQTGLASGASTEAIAQIEEAIADLEAWFGDTIRTNLTTIDQAARYGSTAQEVEHFQGSMQMVLGKPTLTQALHEVLELAGRAGGKLESALSNLMEALGACLAGAGSAAEKALLESLMTDLYHLKSLKTLLEECKTLARNLKRKQDEEGDQQGRQPRQGNPSSGKEGDEASSRR